MKVALLLEYDGAQFSGWQRQANAMSVQQRLEEALGTYVQSECKKAGIVELPGPKITASGRTDAGVHARGQVVSFRWPEQLAFNQRALVAALNGLTPKTIAILEAAPQHAEFDARFSATRKCYQYRIWNRSAPPSNPGYPAWHVRPQLDWLRMHTVAQCFLGTHDFRAFCSRDPSRKTFTRTIYLSDLCRLSRHEFVYTVIGNGFLKQMVRILVGTMVDAGMGNLGPEEVRKALISGERRAAGRTAVPEGLSLEWVRYTHDLWSSEAQ